MSTGILTNLEFDISARDTIDIAVDSDGYRNTLVLTAPGIRVGIDGEHFTAIFHALGRHVLTDVQLSTWVSTGPDSLNDNAQVIQIDTGTEVGRLRVRVNDEPIWDGDPNEDNGVLVGQYANRDVPTPASTALDALAALFADMPKGEVATQEWRRLAVDVLRSAGR